ncbi:hypothetical protein Dimus_002048 [Dionaea muscipula]
MGRGKERNRMAVLVGCNYPNTEYELHGCINDAHAMRKLIIERFGFHANHVEVLTDEPESRVKPTGANIKRAISRMIDHAEAGDVLFFHYSGHGTRIPSSKHHHHHHLLSLRHEEAIVPCDFNLITDVDFREMVNRVPKEVSFTILSDSCHSGGLIDKEKEQIGPSSSSLLILNNLLHHHDHGQARGVITTKTKAKSIPYESILQQLVSLTNIPTSDIGTHLIAHFGDDASPKFKLSQLELGLFERLHPDSGILLSGCQANETSADMPSGIVDGKAYGAFSHAIQMVFKEHQPGQLSSREVVLLARKILTELGVFQHPCLYCSDDNAEAAFLCQARQGNQMR